MSKKKTTLWNKKRKNYIILICLLCVAILATVLVGTVGVLSWFKSSNYVKTNVMVSDFKAEVKTRDNTSFDSANTYSKNQLVSLAPLYVQFSTLENKETSKACLRVKMFISATDSEGTVIVSPDINFTLSDGWVEHEDGYYYYTSALNQNKQLSFIGSISVDNSIDDSVKLSVVAQAETVQYDRATEFFGFDPTS